MRYYHNDDHETLLAFQGLSAETTSVEAARDSLYARLEKVIHLDRMGSPGKWALLIESDTVDFALQFVYASARGELLQEANLKLHALGFILTSHKTDEEVDPETVPDPSDAELRTRRRRRTTRHFLETASST